MSTDSKTTAAFDAAWAEAMRRGVQVPAYASAILDTAERDILRRLVASRLPGGEVEYWGLVEQELKR